MPLGAEAFHWLEAPTLWGRATRWGEHQEPGIRGHRLTGCPTYFTLLLLPNTEAISSFLPHINNVITLELVSL